MMTTRITRLHSTLAALGLLLFAAGAWASTPTARGSAPFRDAVKRYYGLPSTSVAKIINGTNAQWTEHPWQAALLVSWIADPGAAQFCGGALLGEEWVVTAAHCVEGDTQIEDVNVLTGTAKLDGTGRRLNVAEIFVHDRYNPHTYDYDIALLRLRGAATGTPILPVTPEEEGDLLVEGEKVTVAGWGVTETGAGSRQLKEVMVPLVSAKRCNGPASYDGLVTQQMICAGLDAGGLDACQGDSGGPCTKGGRLIGIVSWGEGCGVPFKYGVYSRVALLESWLSTCMTTPSLCEAK